MKNIKCFKITKFTPETELAIERGEITLDHPACALTMVVKDVLKTKLFLQGHDTIINGKGFIKTGPCEFTLHCYNNKQVANLMAYYSKVFK